MKKVLGVVLSMIYFGRKTSQALNEKKKSFQKIPSVATSSKWNKYYKKKQDGKEQNETSKLERKLGIRMLNENNV